MFSFRHVLNPFYNYPRRHLELLRPWIVHVQSPRRCSGSGAGCPGVCANIPALYRVGIGSYRFYAQIISPASLNDQRRLDLRKKPLDPRATCDRSVDAFFTANIGYYIII